MFYCVVLFWFVLFSKKNPFALLCFFLWYCSIICCFMLYWFKFFCVGSCCFVLCCFAFGYLYCFSLCHIVLFYFAIVLYCIVLLCYSLFSFYCIMLCCDFFSIVLCNNMLFLKLLCVISCHFVLFYVILCCTVSFSLVLSYVFFNVMFYVVIYFLKIWKSFLSFEQWKHGSYFFFDLFWL